MLGHSTLCLNLKSGPIDFIANSNKVCSNNHYQVASGFKPNTHGYDQVNPYHFENHYDGIALEFMREVFAAMNEGNHDNSDIQSDYFNVGWYVAVNVGYWNKDYILTA